MIKIKKSADVPQILQDATPPADYKSIDKKIYTDESVKRQLRDDQHGKCSYCECSLTGQFGDVEHYRPKNEYYALAYVWDNLLLSCEVCNRVCKNKKFPLFDESKRKVIEEERPLIINPAKENPADFIQHKRYLLVPTVKDGVEDRRGKYNIDLFKLNIRKDLVEKRRNMWEQLQRIEKIIKLADGLCKKEMSEGFEMKTYACALYDALKDNNNEFIGMIKHQAML